jgi:hypothetical protein
VRAPGDRARKMAGRVGRALTRAGVDDGVASAVLDVLAAALGHRQTILPDPDDHRLLHPARSVLILLEDAGVRDGGLLAAAAALDSRFSGLAPPAIPWPEAIPDGPEAVVRELPLPQWATEAPDPGGDPGGALGGVTDLAETSAPEGVPDDRLLEALVILPPPLLAVALCEALDHLRHLHVEEGRPRLGRGVELARSVYLPASSRLGGVLERRFRWWHDTLRKAL